MYLLFSSLYNHQKGKENKVIPHPVCILQAPSKDTCRDFYMTYIDFKNRFCVLELKPDQEYSPEEKSRLISICSHIPKKPFFIRKAFLYLKSLPEF